MTTIATFVFNMYVLVSDVKLYTILTVISEICNVFRMYPTMFAIKVCVDMVREVQKIILFNGTITVCSATTSTTTTNPKEGGPIMDYITMFKYDGEAVVHMLVSPSEYIDYRLSGWEVERRKKARPRPTAIPCTPLPSMIRRKHEYKGTHDAVIDERIVEEVNCGICGTLHLEWRLVDEHDDWTVPSFIACQEGVLA